MVGHLMLVYLHLFLLVFLHFGDHYMEELIKLFLEMLEEIHQNGGDADAWQKLKIK
jgi:hypothetical protein